MPKPTRLQLLNIQGYSFHLALGNRAVGKGTLGISCMGISSIVRVSYCFLEAVSSLLYDFQEDKIDNFFLLPLLVLSVKAKG